jgi:hypothetical protein
MSSVRALKALTGDVAATAGRANHRRLRAHSEEFRPGGQGLGEVLDARSQATAGGFRVAAALDPAPPLAGQNLGSAKLASHFSCGIGNGIEGTPPGKIAPWLWPSLGASPARQVRMMRPVDEGPVERRIAGNRRAALTAG